jgi:hypothetical protein
MAHTTSTALEPDLESRSPALQLLLNKSDIPQLCDTFSQYCRNYYLAIRRRIPEAVELFISDLNEVAKTARYGSHIFGRRLNINSDTETGTTLIPIPHDANIYNRFRSYVSLIPSTTNRYGAHIPRLLSAIPKISYLQSSLAHLARYNPHFPVRVVLAMKIVQWKVDPLPLINQELRRCRTNANELRPFMSDFTLSSQCESSKRCGP